MLIFPMAGLSSRFRDAGYASPKYMLPVHGHTAFDYSVGGFLDAFRNDEFYFIFREIGGIREFLEARLRALAVQKPVLIELQDVTAGQADTVMQGLRIAATQETSPLTIFNIDTFRIDFRLPPFWNNCDGYLEVFRGEGANWSFVEADQDRGHDSVKRTTEKDPISDLCCSGLYHFARFDDFAFAFFEEGIRPSTPLKERYVAPIYNHLIAAGRDIRFDLIPQSNVVFCGVPSEYENILLKPESVLPIRNKIEQ